MYRCFLSCHESPPWPKQHGRLHQVSYVQAATMFPTKSPKTDPGSAPRSSGKWHYREHWKKTCICVCIYGERERESCHMCSGFRFWWKEFRFLHNLGWSYIKAVSVLYTHTVHLHRKHVASLTGGDQNILISTDVFNYSTMIDVGLINIQ